MSNPHFKMPKVQVLVADASRARFFTLDTPSGPLQEIATHINPDGRLHSQDLITDRPGRAFQRKGEARSSMDEPTDPKDTEMRRFAKELVGQLEKARSRGALERLYLVAPPRFLGELRRHLKDELKHLVVEEISKDLSHLDSTSLRTHLPELIK